MSNDGSADGTPERHIGRMDMQTAVVVALDCSWEPRPTHVFDSMKQALISFDDLLRAHFTHDFLHIIGFSAYARTVERDHLPDLRWDENLLGTNMQAALLLAQEVLYPYTTDKREIIMLTGGEPTAHLERGRSYFAYPPSAKTMSETLKAARDCSDAGIHLLVWNVIEQSRYLDEFCLGVAQMPGGRVIYTLPEKLADAICSDYAVRHMKWS